MSRLNVNYLAPQSGSIIRVIGAISGTFIGTISTASYVEIQNVDGYIDYSSSVADRSTTNEQIVTTLVNATSSYLLNTTDTLDGDLTVTGKITAQEFFTEVVSSSIIYESGSTKFGDSYDDKHEFTGSLEVEGGITGSLLGVAATASYVNSTNVDGFVEFSSSVENRITELEFFSSSLDATYATDIEVQNLSNSFDFTISFLSGALTDRINGNLFNIDQNANEIFDLKLTSASHDSRITALENFSSSLNTNFATDEELALVSSSIVLTLQDTSASLSNRIETNDSEIGQLNIDSASFSLRITSNDNDIAQLVVDSSSFSNRVSVNEANIFVNETNINILTSQTSSYLLNTTDTLDGDLTVTGKITAQEFFTEVVSSSIIYESGSTKFGDSYDDKHEFTGSLEVEGGITGSLLGVATSASYVLLNDIDGYTQFSSSLELRFTQNETSFSLNSSSVEGRLTNLEDFSSSLDATFATDSELSNFSSSILSSVFTISSSFQSRINSNDYEIFLLQTDSASFSNRVTLNENSIISLENDSASFSNRVSDLEEFSSSLNATFATDSEVAAVSSSITTRVATNEQNIASLTSVTSSYLLNTTDILEGDLTVTGKITAQEFHTEVVSSSIIYESGSTKFGDSLDDIHLFTGSLLLTGSLEVNGSSTFNNIDKLILTGSMSIEGSLNVSETITGSLHGTASYSNTSSFSFTASFIDGGFY